MHKEISNLKSTKAPSTSSKVPQKKSQTQNIRPDDLT